MQASLFRIHVTLFVQLVCQNGCKNCRCHLTGWLYVALNMLPRCAVCIRWLGNLPYRGFHPDPPATHSSVYIMLAYIMLAYIILSNGSSTGRSR